MVDRWTVADVSSTLQRIILFWGVVQSYKDTIDDRRGSTTEGNSD